MIIIKHKQNKTCQLIDMGVSADSNISAKEFEKLSKYKNLEIEIAKMWKVKTKTIPVIVGALGMIKKGTQKYVTEIPGNFSLAEIQKIVLIVPLIFLEESFHSKRKTIFFYHPLFSNFIRFLFLCSFITE